MLCPLSEQGLLVVCSGRAIDLVKRTVNRWLFLAHRFLHGPGTSRQKLMEIRSAIMEDRPVQVRSSCALDAALKLSCASLGLTSFSAGGVGAARCRTAGIPGPEDTPFVMC